MLFRYPLQKWRDDCSFAEPGQRCQISLTMTMMSSFESTPCLAHHSCALYGHVAELPKESLGTLFTILAECFESSSIHCNDGVATIAAAAAAGGGGCIGVDGDVDHAASRTRA